MGETHLVLRDSPSYLRAARRTTRSATPKQRLQRTGREDWRQILSRRRREVSPHPAREQSHANLPGHRGGFEKPVPFGVLYSRIVARQSQACFLREYEAARC